MTSQLPDGVLDGPRIPAVDLAGMPDRYLLNELLRAHGFQMTLRTIADQWSAYFETLNAEHERRTDERKAG